MKNRTRLKLKKIISANALLLLLSVTSIIAILAGCAVGKKGNPVSTLASWMSGEEEETENEEYTDDSDDPQYDTEPQEETSNRDTDETKGESTKPADTKPAETKPAETKPADTKPADTKPADTKPAETKPADTKPAETKPAETQSPKNAPETEPPVSDPAVIERRNSADYYNDVLFIGDSRTVGLASYGKISGAKYYAKTSMSVFNALKLTESETGPKEGLIKYLSENKFGKIYILLGINEIGYAIDNIVNKYSEVIGEIRKVQPDAIIVIQSNMNVTKTKSDNNPQTFNNSRINELNLKLSKLADWDKVYFINFAPLFNGSDGALISDYTGDGVHLKAKYYSIWKDFLLGDGRC